MCGCLLHRDLQQLYNQLVEGGILSEGEFWKGRQNLLKESLRGSRDARQQAGFKTAMISEQAGEGGSRKVSVVLHHILQDRLIHKLLMSKGISSRYRY